MSIAGVHLSPGEMVSRIASESEETMRKLQEIWQEAGYEEAETKGLLGDFYSKFEQMCIAELDSERQILEHAKETVQKKIGQLKELYAQLGRQCPYNGESLGQNVTDQLSAVEKLISEINVEVNAREALMTVEIDAIDAVVNDLGHEGPGEDLFRGAEDTPKLSDARLQILKNCRSKFDAMKSERIGSMEEILSTCHSYCEDMKVVAEGWDTVPESETYGDVDSAITAWGESKTNTLNAHITTHDKLVAREKTLLEEKERRREMLASTGGEIARLWTLLRVPNDARDAFQSSFQMNLSMETLARGRDELDRLRDLRLASLGDVINNIRVDIAGLWADAGIEREELRMQEFPAYFGELDCVTEEILAEHEQYYATLKGRVELLRPLLQKVSRREAWVQERLQLEALQMNPERLTARGPKAREDRKKEEHMQSNVKKLEKLTKELRKSIMEWEDTNSEHFVFAGVRYVERIDQQEAEYVEHRDSLRNARKKKSASADVARMSTSAPSLPGSKNRRITQSSSRPTKQARTASAPSVQDKGVLSTTCDSDVPAVDAENIGLNDRNSTASAASDRSSVTEVKVRPSTATAVRSADVQ